MVRIKPVLAGVGRAARSSARRCFRSLFVCLFALFIQPS